VSTRHRCSPANESRSFRFLSTTPPALAAKTCPPAQTHMSAACWIRKERWAFQKAPSAPVVQPRVLEYTGNTADQVYPFACFFLTVDGRIRFQEENHFRYCFPHTIALASRHLELLKAFFQSRKRLRFLQQNNTRVSQGVAARVCARFFAPDGPSRAPGLAICAPLHIRKFGAEGLALPSAAMEFHALSAADHVEKASTS
jgi:hypothetical protein